MQRINTEKMATISRAEYERLQQENAQLEAKRAKLEEQHAKLEAKFAAREQEQAQVITSLAMQNEWLPENERICSACGSELVEIGKEVRRTLQIKPAEFWVCEDVYYTYARKNCEQETREADIVKTVKEFRTVARQFFRCGGDSLYLTMQKFVMYSTLYRLE